LAKWSFIHLELINKGSLMQSL